MTLTITFAVSGGVLALLIIAKRYAKRYKILSYPLKLISHGDERARELVGQLAHLYSESKERLVVYIKKDLPMDIKVIWSKLETWYDEEGRDHLQRIRDTKLLRKKDDGISEFFKSISERDSGRIDEEWEEPKEDLNTKKSKTE
ncbi:MAG: hypothetical protein Q8O98_01605 [bacterium]|nr:hypothetical protein [bacterium]